MAASTETTMSKELAEKKDCLETLEKMRDLKVSARFQKDKNLAKLLKQYNPQGSKTGKLIEG